MPTRYPIILRHDDGRPAVLSSTINPARAGRSVPCHCAELDVLDAVMRAAASVYAAKLDAEISAASS